MVPDISTALLTADQRLYRGFAQFPYLSSDSTGTVEFNYNFPSDIPLGMYVGNGFIFNRDYDAANSYIERESIAGKCIKLTFMNYTMREDEYPFFFTMEIMNNLSSSVNSSLEWHRSKVQEPTSQGYNQSEISRILQIIQPTINRDVYHLRQLLNCQC